MRRPDKALPSLLCNEPTMPGLLWAIRFDASGRATLIPRDETVDLGSPGEGFAWLHFNLADARLERLIADGTFGDPDFVRPVFANDPHQRLLVNGEFVGGAVADLRPTEGERIDPASIGRLHFLAGPRFIISGRRRETLAAKLTRDAVSAGTLVGSPAELLETIVQNVVTVLRETAEGLLEDLDAIEEDVMDPACSGDERKLGIVRRDSLRLHRQLVGLRNVFRRLEDTEAAIPTEAARVATRLAQKLDALDRDLVAAAERSRLLQDEMAAQTANRTNKNLYLLSVLTALFLPPTLVTGFFGMNTKGLPFAESEYGTLYAAMIAVTTSLVALAFIWRLGIFQFRRK